MSTTHNTSNGRTISMESLRLENEHIIAVGNTKTNARGDSLGPGGVPQTTRQQNINEYYNLHTPVAGGKPLTMPAQEVQRPVLREQQFDSITADPLIEEQDAFTNTPTAVPTAVPAVATVATARPARGSLANSFTKK